MVKLWSIVWYRISYDQKDSENEFHTTNKGAKVHHKVDFENANKVLTINLYLF